jgi:hypothetical protein
LPEGTIVTADGDGNIVLHFDDNDEVIISKSLLNNGSFEYGVQNVAFADGTVWHYEDLLEKVSRASPDVLAIYGDKSANVLDGGGVSGEVVGNGGGTPFCFSPATER